MTEKTEPWEQQQYERDKPFYLFTIYRDLGAFRTLEKVRQYLIKNDGGDEVPSLSALTNHSAKWKWVSRCEAWDQYLDEVARTEQEKAFKEMKKRQATESAKFQEMAYNLKDEIEFMDETKPTAKAWMLGTLVNAYGTAAMIEQDARGEPEDEDDKKSGMKELAKVFETCLPEDEPGSEEDD